MRRHLEFVRDLRVTKGVARCFTVRVYRWVVRRGAASGLWSARERAALAAEMERVG